MARNLSVGDAVSIAFRRSVRSRPRRRIAWPRPGPTGSPLPFGVQCVPDLEYVGLAERVTPGLHCLSAFSAFPTMEKADKAIVDTASPLPFGVQCVPDVATSVLAYSVL